MPFVGAAGQLLTKLLAGSASARGRLHQQRAHVPAAGKPRPAAGRNPVVRAAPLAEDRADPAEADLHARQLRHEAALRPAGRDHPGARPPQDVVLGGNPVTLYPIFHPAAALYTPRMLQVLAGGLRADPGAPRPRAAPRPPRRRAEQLVSPEPVGPEPRRVPARPLPSESASASVVATQPTSSPRRRRRSRARAGRGPAAPGDVVAVSGELGAGKTTFVRGAPARSG